MFFSIPPFISYFCPLFFSDFLNGSLFSLAASQERQSTLDQWISSSLISNQFKPNKNLSHLSCSVPTPAWPPETQMPYLGKGSKVPKYHPVCGLSFVLAVPSVAGHSAASALVTQGCYSPWPDPGMKKGPGGTPCPCQHC